MVQMTSVSRKQRVAQAIAHALSQQWELAAEVNRVLLEDDADDTEAANRLGKALTELGDSAGAIEAYEHTLAVEPMNAIARKNIARLGEGGTKPAGGGKRRAKARPRKAASDAAPPSPVRPNALIEESGRSVELSLLKPDHQALGKLEPGVALQLRSHAGGIEVLSPTGTVVGQIERRVGSRLHRLIEGGNEYAVVLRRADDEAAVYIREVRRHPSLADQASFLQAASSERRSTAPRAYTKPSVVTDDREQMMDADDDEGAERPARGPQGGRGAAAGSELEAAGFSETNEAPDAEEEPDDDADDELDAESDDEDEQAL